MRKQFAAAESELLYSPFPEEDLFAVYSSFVFFSCKLSGVARDGV